MEVSYDIVRTKSNPRHSGAMSAGPRKAPPEGIEPGVSGFPDAQSRIRGLVPRTIPEMTFSDYPPRIGGIST
jgi:hypothetical protein